MPLQLEKRMEKNEHGPWTGKVIVYQSVRNAGSNNLTGCFVPGTGHHAVALALGQQAHGIGVGLGIVPAEPSVRHALAEDAALLALGVAALQEASRKGAAVQTGRVAAAGPVVMIKNRARETIGTIRTAR
jgi:hypothetical protein